MPTTGTIDIKGKGTLEFELYDETPNTSKNFATLIEKGFYDGVSFHRVIPGFVVQGGDPNTKTGQGRPGTGGPGYNIKCECYGGTPKQVHEKGALSMAHAGKDTGGSQFFIVLTREQTKHLDGKHTVFGKITSGLELLDSITQGDVMEKVELNEVSDTIKNQTLTKV